MMATKTSHDSYAAAHYRLPDAYEDFCEDVLNMDPAELLHHMEAFAVNGTRGVAKSSRKLHSECKKDVTEFLQRTLRKYTPAQLCLLY